MDSYFFVDFIQMTMHTDCFTIYKSTYNDAHMNQPIQFCWWGINKFFQTCACSWYWFLYKQTGLEFWAYFIWSITFNKSAPGRRKITFTLATKALCLGQPKLLLMSKLNMIRKLARFVVIWYYTWSLDLWT